MIRFASDHSVKSTASWLVCNEKATFNNNMPACNYCCRIVTSETGNTYTQQPTNYRIAPRLQSLVLQSDPQKDTKLDSQYKDMESSLKELLQIFNYLNRGYHYDPYKRIKHPKGGQLRSKLLTEDQIAPLRDTSNSEYSIYIYEKSFMFVFIPLFFLWRHCTVFQFCPLRVMFKGVGRWGVIDTIYFGVGYFIDVQ